MKIKDYDEKMKYAMDFYDQATAIQQMIHDSIRGFHYLYCYDFYNERDVNNQLFKELIEKRKRQFLIEMGRVGEYAIKYLLLIEQMRKYPNQTIEEFTKKFMYNIGEKGVRNTYINQYHLDPNLINEILAEKEQHPLQPLHDYSYLFSILEKLFPNVVKHLQENILFNIKGYNCLESEFLTKDDALLADFFSSIQFLESTELTNEKSKEYIEEYRKNITESGDVFTKLRYLENNTDNKQYNMEWVMYLMDQLIDYITLIHEYNKDNPESNIEVAYVKRKITEYIMPQGLRKYDEIYGEKAKKELEMRENANTEVLEVLNKYPELLDSIDYAQITIWRRFNNKDFSYKDAISNLIRNLIDFKNNPDILLNKFPILLPKEHNLETYEFLKKIGVDICVITKEESSILCVPIEYLKKGYESMKNSNVSAASLIAGINKVLYNNGLNNDSVLELPLRHR